jgi:hypothetical protein
VNTAARAEEATRDTGDVILLTEATRRLLRADHGGFVERVDVPLKGKTERVPLYAPAAVAARARPAADADGGPVVADGDGARPAADGDGAGAAARDAMRASRGR